MILILDLHMNRYNLEYLKSFFFKFKNEKMVDENF